MIDVCAGSVSGTVVRAFVNLTPREATLSSVGVKSGEIRSARNVSIVTKRRFSGRADRVAADGAHPQLNAMRNAAAIRQDAGMSRDDKRALM
jgi:hypothetical protein